MRLFNRVSHAAQLNHKLLIVSLVVLLSALTPLFSQLIVNAKTYSDMNAQEQAQSISYYQVLGQCVWNNMKGTITIDASAATGTTPNAATSLWYDSGENAHNIYTERGQSCQTITDKALSLWGWGSNTGQFLSDMGYKWNSGAHSYEGPGGFSWDNHERDQRRTMFFDLIKNRIYGGADPSMTDAGKYEMYYQAAISDPCNMKDLGLYATNPNETYKAYVADPNNLHTESNGDYTTVYRIVRLVGEDKKADDHIVSYNRSIDSGGASVPTSYNSYGFRAGGAGNGGLTEDCTWYVDGLGQMADAFATVAQSGSVPVPGGALQTGQPPQGDKSSCTIPGIGWIVCPVTSLLAHIADGVYNVLQGLLTVPALNTDVASKSNGTYIAWSYMRNVANIVFVIVFVFIIYSQLTGMGVTNYGIKKLLPKLIVAAILVNASYWICAIAVDISNILGMSMRGFLDAAAKTMPMPDGGDPTAKENWFGVTVLILAAAGGVVYMGLTILLPIMIAALAAATTAFIVLVIRQALIVILIFIAPLAFVAYLLPNTEKWFDRWRETFMALLLMFPVISLVFGGANLASRVLLASSISIGDDPQGWFLKIVAAGITVIPLFLVPFLMKAGGGLLNRFAGVVNNPNKGVFDRMRKGADGFRNSRQTLRDAKSFNRTGWRKALDVRGYDVRRRARSEATLKARQRESQLGSAEYIAKTVDEGTGPTAWKLRHDLAGGGGAAGAQRATISAINTLDQLQTAEVKEANILIQHAELSGKERQELAMKGSVTKDGKTYSGETMQKAAVLNQLKTGSMADIEDIVMNSGGSLSQFKQSISQAVAENGLAAKNPALGGKYLDQIAQGKINGEGDLNRIMLEAMKEGKFTAAAVAGMHDSARERAINLARANPDPSYKTALKEAVAGINRTPELRAKIAGNSIATRQVSDIQGL